MNTTKNRRDMLRVGLAFVALPSALVQLGCTQDASGTPETSTPPSETSSDDSSTSANKEEKQDTSAKVQYLEIVTTEVEAICKTYSAVHGVKFSDQDANLGGARTTKLANGGMLGIRAPLRKDEKPVVRHYFLVKDIKAKVDEAAKSGAEVAVPPMELPGHGICAIVIQGGIEAGYWQL